MKNNKLTDKEIVKALECCIKSSHFGECFDNKCPLVSEKGCEVGKETLYPYALDLINRLQAEVNRLDNESDALLADIDFRDKEINELQEENEMLKKDNEHCLEDYIIKSNAIHKKALETAKTEAYKECIEKAKELSIKKVISYVADFSIQERETGWFEISEEKLDNLLKELVGEDNEMQN